MFPSNESETIKLYELAQYRLGWPIAHLQTRFPDAIIENGDGQQLIAEFEHLAKNFYYHNHDPNGCDLIICWRNNWPNAPLPVWALNETILQSEIDNYRHLMDTRIAWYEYELSSKEREIQRLRELNGTLLEQLETSRSNVAGVHYLTGVTQVYTSTDRECERFCQFMDEVLTLPEVQIIQRRWMNIAEGRAYVHAGFEAAPDVLGNLAKLGL